MAKPEKDREEKRLQGGWAQSLQHLIHTRGFGLYLKGVERGWRVSCRVNDMLRVAFGDHSGLSMKTE